jgi:hypothetical protein
MELFENVWGWRVQVVPVLILYCVFEGFTALRRLRKFYYIPMYFTVVPLYEVNDDLATYLGEDSMVLAGRDLTAAQADRLRRRIMLRAVISMIIAAVLTPLIVGLIAVFVASPEAFGQFLIILGTLRAWALIRAWLQFRELAPDSPRNHALLGAVYVAYLIVLLYLCREAYVWATPYARTHDYAGLLSALADLLIKRVLINGLIMGVLAGLLGNGLADRELRRRKLEADG